MSNAILIIGESGSGKSTAIRTLPAEQTFIINVLDKPLPFRGSRKMYTKAVNGQGNMLHTDNFRKIRETLNYINHKRLDIKYIVLDDLGYTLQNDYMRKAMLKGYEKYTEMGRDFSELIDAIKVLRDDLFCFVTMHVTSDNQGKTKPKTVGKMIDEHVCIEGHFSYVFHTLVSDGNYKFLTNYDGLHMAKSPMDMFPATIPNDLKLVVDTILEYEYGEDWKLEMRGPTEDEEEQAQTVHDEEAAYALGLAADGCDRGEVA